MPISKTKQSYLSLLQQFQNGDVIEAEPCTLSQGDDLISLRSTESRQVGSGVLPQGNRTLALIILPCSSPPFTLENNKIPQIFLHKRTKNCQKKKHSMEITDCPFVMGLLPPSPAGGLSLIVHLNIPRVVYCLNLCIQTFKVRHDF